jgi:flagellar biosynthesis protein FlhF
MNIRRFTAATAREALAKARAAFGDGTLILSNRPVANGVEVVATAEESLSDLEAGHDAAMAAAPARIAAPKAPAASGLQARAAAQVERPALGAARAPVRTAPVPAVSAAPAAPARSAVQDDTEQLAMSTLSFQEYVRERMLRRRHEELTGQAQGLAADEALIDPAPLTMPVAERVERMERSVAPALSGNAPARNAQAVRTVQHALPAAAAARAAAPVPQRRVATAPAAASKGVVDELQSMRELIEDRFNTLSWLGQAKQDPIQSNLMLKLIRAGYSPTLARAVLERLPQEANAGEAVRWLMDVLQRNLHTTATPLAEEGGIFALVGSTGVGKTTTAAKLAAQCARQHGPQSVGLITLDTYRVAAHEQLRAYGRMLGVVAHLAHDRAALQDLLGLLANKKMVLIDTTGVAPRDPRKRDLLDVLDLPGVQRMLVLNAGGHGDTLDEVVTSFKTTGAQQAILSKVDEAVKLGPAVDALIRHQLVLRGVTNGQRVPEDWEEADAGQLVRASMRSPAKSAFDPKAADLSFFFSSPSSVPHSATAGGATAGSMFDA